MFDIHTHILPGIDDGSDSVDLSIQMLKEEVSQGIKGIAVTPHFYADSDSPERFIARRRNAVLEVSKRLTEVADCPPILLGAEVHFYTGMSRSDSLRNLTIGGTDYILVEMPFRPWNRSFIGEIRDIGNNLNLQVIVAHFNRYLDRDKDLVEELIYDSGALMQANAEAFTDRKTRRKMLKYLKEGTVHFLGSDCHNMTDRRPDLADAYEIISKEASALRQIDNRSIELFRKAGAQIAGV